MSGTYRFGIAILRDGHGGRGATARTGAAEMKKIDRRKKRREHKRIISESVAELIEEREISERECWQLEEGYAEFDSFDDSMYELARDFSYDGDYGVDHPGYSDDFNDDYWVGDYENHLSWYHEDDYACADGYYAKLRMPRAPEAYEAGKSLGDVLANALKAKRDD